MQIPLVQTVLRLVVIVRVIWAILSWIGRTPPNRRPWVIITLLGAVAVLSRNRGMFERDNRPLAVRTTAGRGQAESRDRSSVDDLTVIEGIGAKIAAALAAAGIDTFARLARASEPELRSALAAAGMRFAPSLSTWAQQAAYAARGEWGRLESYKSALTAGREHGVSG